MLNISDFEAHILSPLAQHSARTLGRRYPEPEHPWRGPFMRDRDRIIHSSAFRRLEFKTQVFVIFEGDYYRNRLTHTIEVAQIARTIARGMGLNEDLAEAVALAHDLGHPPFGHTGEHVLHDLMQEHGGFEHNRQSLRIVEQLETRYPMFPGLNLCFEVREGIAKHKTSYDTPEDGLLERDPGMPTLEAQLVNVADEITYSSHDVDDGLQSRILAEDDLRESALCRGILEDMDRDARLRNDPAMRHYQLIRNLIDRQVNDLITQTRANIREHGVETIEHVRTAPLLLAAFSPDMANAAQELRDLLMARFYRHPRVASMSGKATRILTALFDAFLADISLLSPESRARSGEVSPRRMICDYIAGMTDRYAMAEHKRLFNDAAPE
jgi:dGTPase